MAPTTDHTQAAIAAITVRILELSLLNFQKISRSGGALAHETFKRSCSNAEAVKCEKDTA